MKPWGSQPTISTFFPISDTSLYAPKRELTIGGRRPAGLPREQGRWLAGVQGAAMSPWSPAWMRRNLGTDAAAYRLGLQSTMRAATLLPGTATVLRSDGVGPVIPIRRVAHSLRTASAQVRG
jgi:hypothetical protein